MANACTKFNDERNQDPPQGKNLSIAEMASAYTKFMDDAEQKANKLLLEDQQRELLSNLEVNMEEEMENHEDNTLRSGREIEKTKEVEELEEVEEVEEVGKELDELEEIKE